LQISLGTVKSRITRGRDALRKKLKAYVREAGSELGLALPDQQEDERSIRRATTNQRSTGGREFEVAP